MKLKDKVAIVTGSAQGIGRAIAIRYAEEGAHCAIADIDLERASETAGEIEAAGAEALAVACDVTRQADIDDLVRTVVEWKGRIDILVNNAGFFDMGPLLEVDRDAWDKLFGVNAKGLFFTLQAVARRMVEQGDGGKIINLASQAGRHGIALVSQYCAAKAAVISITQSAALELIKNRINVNAISPGVVDTRLWATADRLFARYLDLPPGEKKRQASEAVPYGRMGTPEDLVGTATFLASSDADYIVGQTLNVDGGNRLN
ncbi:MAG: L-iditol 2-dehydrogenase [Alphaproteobacteria bacterium]